MEQLSISKFGDIDFESRNIIMKHTKNRKQQIIPLSNVITLILAEYLEYRKGEPEEYLFCSRYGQKLNKNSLGRSISKYNTRRGVTKTSVHLFRHWFAKNWVINKQDIFELQKILGHSSLDMVKRYVEIYSDDISVTFETFNPLDNLVKNKINRKALAMRK